jgi:hypothetical protein
MLVAAHKAGRLKFFASHEALADEAAFSAYVEPLRNSDWVVYAKKPPEPVRGRLFAGPEAVLAYLSRYTHRVAISNHRLISVDENRVKFKYKDYRIEGPDRYKTMTLDVAEFIRRFLMHVLPKRFHRIRHTGLLANGNRAANIARARELLDVSAPTKEPDAKAAADPDEPSALAQPCSCCGGRMIVIEVFEAGRQPKHRPRPEGIDSS